MKTLLIIIISCASFTITIAQLQKSTEDSALVEVVVKDFNDKVRVHDRVLFEGQKTKVIIQGTTDEFGKFRLLLPEGDTYNIAMRGLGENQKYNTFEIPKTNGRYALSTILIKYEPSKSFTLKNLQFESNKSTIKIESESILAELIELLQLKPTMTIELSGHTDGIGNEETNMLLSKERAESVKKYLFQKGKIKSDRITTKGYGESMPIAENETEAGRQLNRRTVVRILSE